MFRGHPQGNSGAIPGIFSERTENVHTAQIRSQCVMDPLSTWSRSDVPVSAISLAKAQNSYKTSPVAAAASSFLAGRPFCCQLASPGMELRRVAEATPSFLDLGDFDQCHERAAMEPVDNLNHA